MIFESDFIGAFSTVRQFLPARSDLARFEERSENVGDPERVGGRAAPVEVDRVGEKTRGITNVAAIDNRELRIVLQVSSDKRLILRVVAGLFSAVVDLWGVWLQEPEDGDLMLGGEVQEAFKVDDAEFIRVPGGPEHRGVSTGVGDFAVKIRVFREDLGASVDLPVPLDGDQAIAERSGLARDRRRERGPDLEAFPRGGKQSSREKLGQVIEVARGPAEVEQFRKSENLGKGPRGHSHRVAHQDFRLEINQNGGGLGPGLERPLELIITGLGRSAVEGEIVNRSPKRRTKDARLDPELDHAVAKTKNFGLGRIPSRGFPFDLPVRGHQGRQVEVVPHNRRLDPADQRKHPQDADRERPPVESSRGFRYLARLEIPNFGRNRGRRRHGGTPLILL